MVAEHPLLRVHPETTKKLLFVSPNFLHDIVGLTPTETKAILKFLQAHEVRPEFTVRFQWKPGSIAIWYSRATCHLPPRVIYMPNCKFERCFYRTTFMGPTAYGADGQESKQLEGKPVGCSLADQKPF